MIIDVHTHVFPDRVAPAVLRRLAESSGLAPVADGTAADVRDKARSGGADRAVLLPIATSLHYQANNDFAAALDGDFFLSFGSVHPADPQPEAAVEQVAGLGLHGLKLHPQYQGVAIDDPRYVRILRRAAALRLPVLFHAGWDPGLPGPFLAEPAATARLLDQVEDLDGLVLIAAHLGGLDRYDAVEQYLVGRNIWFDTAMVAGRVSPAQFRRIIENHGWQRVLLGSDCPWQSTAAAIRGVRELGLPAEQTAAILGGNAARLFRLQSR